MSCSKTPRMKEFAKRKAREAAAEIRENRKRVRSMIALGASRREISIALGIPEDSLLFEQL